MNQHDDMFEGCTKSVDDVNRLTKVDDMDESESDDDSEESSRKMSINDTERNIDQNEANCSGNLANTETSKVIDPDNSETNAEA